MEKTRQLPGPAEFVGHALATAVGGVYDVVPLPNTTPADPMIAEVVALPWVDLDELGSQNTIFDPEPTDVTRGPHLWPVKDQNEHPHRPGVEPLDGLPERDVAHRRLAEILGSLALRETMRPETKNRITLAEALLRARNGDPEAEELAMANIATEVYEIVERTGIAMEVELDIVEQDGDIEIRQHGQPYEEIFRSTWEFGKHDGVRQNLVNIEGLNGLTIKELVRQGKLDDRCVVEISLPPERSDEANRKDGYFTETMTGIVRVISKEGNKLKIVSIMFAGVAEQGGQRHDIQAVRELLAEHLSDPEMLNLGVDQILKKGAHLIPKTALPNGAASIQEWLDQHILRVANRQRSQDDAYTSAFCGQLGKEGDYANLLEWSKKRLARYAELRQTVYKRMSDYAAYESNDPMDVVHTLRREVDQRGAEMAVADRTINPKNFGRAAAQAVYKARQARDEAAVHARSGRADLAMQANSRAVRFAQRAKSLSKSDGPCPLAKNKNWLNAEDEIDDGLNDLERKMMGLSDEADDSESEGVAADCDYEHTGCYCCKYEYDGRPRDTPKTVTAKRTSRSGFTVATCQRGGCGATLITDKDGKKVFSYKGGIAYRAARLLGVDSTEKLGSKSIDGSTDEAEPAHSSLDNAA